MSVRPTTTTIRSNLMNVWTPQLSMWPNMPRIFRHIRRTFDQVGWMYHHTCSTYDGTWQAGRHTLYLWCDVLTMFGPAFSRMCGHILSIFGQVFSRCGHMCTIFSHTVVTGGRMLIICWSYVDSILWMQYHLWWTYFRLHWCMIQSNTHVIHACNSVVMYTSNMYRFIISTYINCVSKRRTNVYTRNKQISLTI